ncbi:hypothetical protein D3C73_1385100 [compost metagenome]
MGLFHLVQQHDGIWLAAYRFGELAAFLIADITRRRTDKTGNAVLLHILRHINADHAVFAVKERYRQRFCQLRLPYPGRAQEQE